MATADPAPGGSRSDEYGFGLLEPVPGAHRDAGPGGPAGAGAGGACTGRPGGGRAAGTPRRVAGTALIVAAAGAGMVLLVGLVAGVLRRGRRRGWRPADPEPPATLPVATPPDG